MTPRIFWIGDSTVQFNNISTWPQCGMGQVLDLYVRPGIAVYDHARNGRSTKSFYDEGLWAPVEAALCPGDLLLMQFGHNDEKSEDPTRYAAPDQFAADAYDAMYTLYAATKAAGFDNLKGHKSVGGLRASIYNAMPKEGVEALVEVLKKYEAEHA